MKIRIVILATLLVIFCANQAFAQCSVSITPNPASVCAGNSITLTANATGTATITYSWSSGGSGNSTSVAPAITSTYSVNITDGVGCTATASVTVTVNPKPTTSFTFTNNNACAGTANGFTSSVSGGQAPYTYAWNFGGAGTSAQANPSFTFNPAGTGTQTYNVSLTVTDSKGCSATTSQNVTIRRKPDAAIEDQDIFEPWTFCDAGGGSVLTIDNASTTQADNTNYTINWGDASTPYNGATLPNGTAHTYTGQGYFNIVLTVTGSNGCTATTTYPVFSGGNPEIGLANPGGTTGICTDKQLTFPITNFSNNPPGTIYTITVNDGSAPVVFTHPPPSSYTHNFTTSSCGFTSLGGFANAFHVRIVAENPCGTTAALVEPIRLGGAAEADFTFTPPPDICEGSTVNFTSTAEGTYITAQGACLTALQGGWTLTPATGWNLISGNMATPDPVNINFTQSGLYNMRLIVSNPCGTDTTIRPVCVAEPPDANFTTTSLTGCAPITLPITNTSNTVFSCANTTYLWTVTHNGSLCSSGGNWSFQSGNAGSQSPSITFSGSGTYTLSLTITNNCGTNTETKTITIDKIPELTIAPLPNICAGNTINPNAVINPCYSSLTNVSWSFPGGSPLSSTSQNPGAITYSNSGTFTVTLSATNACGTGTDNETFTIAPPPPLPVLSSNSPVCAGQTITINANPINGVTYTWTGPLGFTSGNQNITINNATILQAGTYTLVVTDGLGCTNTASINVVVNSLPIVAVNNPSPLCTGGSVQLNAGGANTYIWTPATGLSATTGATVTANPTSTTTYTVTGTNANGCSNSTTAIVTINPLPNISVTQSPAICVGQSTILTAAGGASYSWSPATGLSGTSGAIVTANPNATTTYTVTGTSAQGCSSTATTTVTVNTLPNVTVNNPPAICAGQSATLNANGANTYTWSPATGLSGTTGATVTANPNSTTTYIVTGTSGGCSNTAQVTVTVNPRPTVTVNSGTICTGSSITLNAGGANTYSWSPATGLSATTGASVTANPTSTTTYTVSGTDGNGCTNSATATVTISNNPTVDAGPAQTFCEQNIPVQLTGTPNGGTWSGTGVTTGGSFNPFAAGLGSHSLTYSFTNAGGCSGSDVVTITVIPPTIPIAGNDFGVCRNAPAINLNTQLNPSPAGGTWSGFGVLFGTFTPSLAFNGPNTITYTTGSGTCEASDAVVITVNPQPNINVNSPSVCAGNSVTLNANGGTTYAWSPATGLSATTGASVSANPTSTTAYTVTGTDVNGCTNTATSTVTVNPLPVVDAGPAQTFCDQNTTIQLVGTPANGTWSGTGVSLTGSFNPASAGIGAHTMTYSFTNGNGCSNNDATTITVVTLTTPVAGNDITVCRDAAIVDLNAQNNPTPSGGTWSGTGVSGNNFNPANANIGQNNITYSFGTGTCLATDVIIITVNALPVVSVNSPDICVGNSVTLNASGATNYDWSPANGLSSTTGASVNANPTSTTTYLITGTDGNNCVNTATSTVTVNPLPIVDAGPAQTFCDQNIPVQLSGTPANGNWTGTGVSPTGSFNPSTAGVGSHQLTYSFTDGNSCSNNDVTTMTVIVPTIANAGNDFPLCRDAAPVDLNAQNNPTPAGGIWTGNGVANNFFTAANAVIGQNEIVYSIGTGTCLSMDTIAITVNPLPTIIVNSPTICESGSTILTANGAINYSWTPTATLSDSVGAIVTASPITTTTYTVRGIDANTCVNTTNAIVTVNPLPIVDAGPDQTFCDQNISVQLSGTPANGNWTGTGVTQTGSFNPSTAGVGSHQLTYSFTDGNSCSNNDVATMTVIVPTIANAGNDFPLCRDAAPVDLNTQNNPTPAGGTWIGNGVANNFFTAANATIGQNSIVYSIGTGTCLSMDTIAITVNPLPTIIVNSPTICESGSTILTANGAINYSWTPTSTLNDSVGAVVTASPTTTTTYTVRGIDANTCVNTTNAIVTVNPLPIVDAGPAQTFCDQNILVQLLGTPANGNWTGTGVTQTGSFNPSTAGVGAHQLTYSFTDGNSCTNDDVTTITVIVPTLANAGNNFPLCRDAAPVDLNAQNNPTPSGGTWTGNGVANNYFTAANAAIGQNSIVYSIGTGTCLSMDTIAVTVNPLPTIAVNSPTICESGSTILTASGAINYSWNPTATLSDSVGAIVTASPITTTTYTVHGTDANSCVNSNAAIVTVNPLPIVDAGPDQTFCNTNTPVTFTGNPANGIWNGTGITSTGIFNPALAGVGVWQLTYSLTDGNNCTNHDTTIATVVDPQLADAGADVAICITGTSVDLATIGATPAGGTWSGTGVTANVFYPFAAGVGQHTLTYSFGTGTCQTNDNTSATVNPQPALSVNSPEICFEDTALLTVFGADNYVWNPMNELSIIGGSVAEAFPSVTTAYMIIGTTAATGCSDTIISTVTVHPLPIVDAGGDTATCNQPQYPTQLQATPTGGIWAGNFTSQNGLFTPSGNAADTGAYSVTYSFTDGNSCSNADNTIVQIIEPVLAVAGPDKTFCVDDSPATLTGFTPATGGVWSGNGIVNSAIGLFNPSLAGVGNSKLFYDYGTGTCATRDSITLTVNPIPTPDLTFNTTCINDTTTFTDLSIANTGTINGWQWSFGNGNTTSVQNPSYVFSPSGNHNVIFEVTNSVGCNSDTTFLLTVHPLPTVAFTHDSMICPDSSLQIYLTTVDALNYNWDFGDSTTGTGINPTHSYSNVGVYEIKLVAETQFGCIDSSSSHVRVPEPPNAFFTFNPKEGCAPLDVSFYPILPPDWTGLRYMWIFGNGDTTFSPIPPDFIQYNAAADGGDTSYVVEFYVFSHTCQNFGKFVDTVKVLNTPPAVVVANFRIGCGQTNVFFTNVNNTVFDSLYIDYGDGTGEIIPTTDLNFSHSFINSTNSNVTYTVTYYATGANCNSIPGTIPVTVYPNTVKADIAATPQDVCLGEAIVLTSNASGASYYYYDLGTGVVSQTNNAAQSITLNLTDTGSFVIYQLVYSADSCSFGKDSLTVRIHPAPISDFEFTQPSSGCDGSEVTFTNISQGYGSSIWDFGDNTTVVGDSPNHIFGEQGNYNVTLITESAAGCKDSLSKPVTIDFLEKGLYVPNAFSPEFGDPKVREFKPAGQCMESYHLHIYNTWGELLWETYQLTPEGEPAEGWNGRHMKTGLLLPQDVYVWKIEAVFINSSVWEGKNYDDGRTKKIGSVTLLR